MTGPLWFALAGAIISQAWALPPQHDADSSLLSHAALSPPQARPSLRGGSTLHQVVATVGSKRTHFKYRIDQQKMIEAAQQLVSNEIKSAISVKMPPDKVLFASWQASVFSKTLKMKISAAMKKVTNMEPESISSLKVQIKDSSAKVTDGLLTLVVGLELHNASPDDIQEIISGTLSELLQRTLFKYRINQQQMIKATERLTSESKGGAVKIRGMMTADTWKAARFSEATQLFSEALREKIAATMERGEMQPESLDLQISFSSAKVTDGFLPLVVSLKMPDTVRFRAIIQKIIEGALLEFHFGFIENGHYEFLGTE